jgi:hypothetical protein
MSMRHFLFPDGRVRSSGVKEIITGEGGATEVQVVPLDAIVIRRDELPEVETHETAHGDTVWVYGGDAFDRDADNRTAEAMRDGALRLLARAEYVREHPPVDEAQVKAIRKALAGFGMNEHDARVLYERGVRVGDA